MRHCWKALCILYYAEYLNCSFCSLFSSHILFYIFLRIHLDALTSLKGQGYWLRVVCSQGPYSVSLHTVCVWWGTVAYLCRILWTQKRTKLLENWAIESRTVSAFLPHTPFLEAPCVRRSAIWGVNCRSSWEHPKYLSIPLSANIGPGNRFCKQRKRNISTENILQVTLTDYALFMATDMKTWKCVLLVYSQSLLLCGVLKRSLMLSWLWNEREPFTCDQRSHSV